MKRTISFEDKTDTKKQRVFLVKQFKLPMPQFEGDDVPAVDTSEPVENVIGFEIDPVFKEGYSCEVFKARRHSERSRVVALRRSKDDDQKLQVMKRSTSCLAKLDHENIVKLFDAFVAVEFGRLEQKQQYWEVLEWVDFNLKEVINQGRDISHVQLIQLMDQLIRSVIYIHSKGIGHNDIKLDNIGVQQLDNAWQLKLFDFGESVTQNGDNLEAFEKAKQKDIAQVKICLADLVTLFKENIGPNLEHSKDAKYKELIKTCYNSTLEELHSNIFLHFYKQRPLVPEYFIIPTKPVVPIRPLSQDQLQCYLDDRYAQFTAILTNLDNEDEYLPDELYDHYVPEILLPQYHSHLEQLQRRSQEPSAYLWNGEQLAIKDVKEENGILQLKFSICRYFHFSAMFQIWLSLGKSEDINIKYSKEECRRIFSNSFGVHMTIRTSDRCILFVSRSSKQAIEKNLITCGFTEGLSRADLDQITAQPNLSKGAARGLYEELGISLTDSELDQIKFLGLGVADFVMMYGIVGYIQVSMTAKQVEERFNRPLSGPKDPWETQRLIFINDSPFDVFNFVHNNGKSIASGCFSCALVTLYNIHGRLRVDSEFIRFFSKHVSSKQ